MIIYKYELNWSASCNIFGSRDNYLWQSEVLTKIPVLQRTCGLAVSRLRHVGYRMGRECQVVSTLGGSYVYGNRIKDPSARSTTLGSSTCICWRNRIRVGFLFRPSLPLFHFFIQCSSCPLFGHYILPYMARDHEIYFGVCEITVYFQNAGMAKNLKATLRNERSE